MILLNNLCMLPLPLFFLLFSLAAVNPDVYTGSSALAPACRVPGVLSAVRDVRQQTGMAWPAGRAVLDGSAVSVVDRQACGSDLPVTGCQSHRRATNQHSPPVIPPDYRQRGSSEFSTWHAASSLRAAVQCIHCGFMIFSSLSVKCIGALAGSVIVSPCVRYSNWMLWKGDSVQVFSPLENVYLQGGHSEADESYKRRRCKPVKWHNCHFITRHISTADPLVSASVSVCACVCLPQTTLCSPFSVSPSDRWHLERFRRCMCHLYPWQGQSMLHDLQDRELEKRY